MVINLYFRSRMREVSFIFFSLKLYSRFPLSVRFLDNSFPRNSELSLFDITFCWLSSLALHYARTILVSTLVGSLRPLSKPEKCELDEPFGFPDDYAAFPSIMQADRKLSFEPRID